MTRRDAPFTDRAEAGRLLGAALRELDLGPVVVVGMTRGGVPVAAEVAAALDAPLEAVAVRKLGYPLQPELGVGAIAEGGTVELDGPLISRLGLARAEVEELVRRETAELERRVHRYHAGRPRIALRGRVVVLVDDGLATGFTARAAVEACRRAGAARVVLAVPVGAPASAAELSSVADEVVCLSAPSDFFAVGQFYETFAQITDDEVRSLLDASAVDGPALHSAAPRGDGASRTVAVPAGAALVAGDLTVPHEALGLVVFAHGSGSSRHSPRNRAVARVLNAGGLATLLLDLLTEQEDGRRHLVFDIDLLAGRLEDALSWADEQAEVAELPIGLFGASTGAAAALVAAADLGDAVGAVVSRGGRPDLASARLAEVSAPTLLIVGELDREVLELNRAAQRLLRCRTALEVVRGATHLFEEPGALDAVARLAADWFVSALAPSA